MPSKFAMDEVAKRVCPAKKCTSFVSVEPPPQELNIFESGLKTSRRNFAVRISDLFISKYSRCVGVEKTDKK